MSVATRADGPVSPTLDLHRSGDTQAARHSPRIRAVLGEHHMLYRTGLELALRETGIEVVSVANNADDLARKTRAYHPDVAVLDIDMPPSLSDHDRVEAARNIRSIDPRLAVLILSERPNERCALAVMGDEPAGFGFVVKARVRDIEDFTTSVREVARGGTAIDPVVVSRLAARRPTDALDRGPDESRAPGPRPDGRGTIQRVHRRRPRRDDFGRRAPYHEYFCQARPAVELGEPSKGACGVEVPRR